MIEHEKALNNPSGGFKLRKIHVPSQKISVDYSEIKQHQAYAIKKFQLYFMFELNNFVYLYNVFKDIKNNNILFIYLKQHDKQKNTSI